MRVITLIWLVLVLPSRVDADSAADATRLFEEAGALQKAGKYAEACAKFEQSFEIDQKASRPAPGTQLNLGECAERTGQLRKAWLLFDDAAVEYGRRAKAAEGALAKDPNSAELKRDLDRALAGVRVGRQKADALAPKLAKVVVRIAEPAVEGLSLRIGDRSVAPAAEVIEYLDTGNVTITATAPNRKPFSASARAESGKQVVVEVPVLELVRAPAVGGGERVPTGPRRQRKRVLIAAAVGGSGAVLFGVSVLVGLGARSEYNDAKKNCVSMDGELVCPTEADRLAVKRAFDKADTATFLGLGGLALAAAGAVLYVTAPKEGMTIAPTATTTSAGITLSGRF